MNVLVTGGAGYIGSHAALRLIEGGHRVCVVDNFVRGNRGAIGALTKIAQASGPESAFSFFECDINDGASLIKIMASERIDAVMHFAALAYVGESVEQPLRYFRANAAGALSLIEACDACGIERFVFSSTCSTYGEPAREFIPIPEACPQRPINPYGESKLMVEWMLRDWVAARTHAGARCSCVCLRYFNVAGADPRARIGEDHKPETHLIPLCLEAAIGQRQHVTIFGTDYETPDGTCIRDYVHVCDLIDAHMVALNALDPSKHEVRAYNLGIGRGYSVREVIDAAKCVTGVDFKVVSGDRRAGDPPTLYSDPARIQRDLNWRARFESLEAMIADAWRWKQRCPNGYNSIKQ